VVASHRRAKTQTRSVMTLTASTAVAAAGVVVLTPTAGQASTLAQVKAQVQTLENQTDTATQKYDEAEEQLGDLQKQVNDIQGEAATAQQTMNKLISSLGPLAAAQYQSGSVSPTLELMLSQSPDQFLQDASAENESDQNTLLELKQLKVDQAQVASLQTEAASRLAQLQQIDTAAATQLKAIQSSLTAQRNLYADMTYAEQQSLADVDVSAAQIAGVPVPTGRIAQVIAFEKSKLGMPYQYGGEGDPSYDCSGLVQAAYASAGISVPRTTFDYEDEGIGTKIPIDLSQMIPGDLIFYGNWVHVATYIGNGLIIQAPRTGEDLDYGEWNEMPIAAVLRIIPQGT
jgi:cell wall-associated NlpC family hydrolase